MGKLCPSNLHQAESTARVTQSRTKPNHFLQINSRLRFQKSFGDRSEIFAFTIYGHFICTYIHKPALALELATLICTDRAPREAQTHQVGPSHQGPPHYSKPQSAAKEQPDPLPTSLDRWSPQDHHKIDPPHQPMPPYPIWTKHLHMTEQFTLETRS